MKAGMKYSLSSERIIGHSEVENGKLLLSESAKKAAERNAHIARSGLAF
jgi:hypothetical protein